MSYRQVVRPHHGVDLPDSARAAIATLTDHPDVRSIIVFGSRASGDHDERSDVDVAIEAPSIDRAELTRIRDRVSQFPTLYRISITVLDTMPDALKQRVRAQGTTIYERPGVRAQGTTIYERPEA